MIEGKVKKKRKRKTNLENRKPLITRNLRERLECLLDIIGPYNKEKDGSISEWVMIKWPIFVERFGFSTADLTFLIYPDSGQFVHITNTQSGTNGISIHYKKMRYIRADSGEPILLISQEQYDYWLKKSRRIIKEKEDL